VVVVEERASQMLTRVRSTNGLFARAARPQNSGVHAHNLNCMGQKAAVWPLTRCENRKAWRWQ